MVSFSARFSLPFEAVADLSSIHPQQPSDSIPASPPPPPPLLLFNCSASRSISPFIRRPLSPLVRTEPSLTPSLPSTTLVSTLDKPALLSL